MESLKIGFSAVKANKTIQTARKHEKRTSQGRSRVMLPYLPEEVLVEKELYTALEDVIILSETPRDVELLDLYKELLAVLPAFPKGQASPSAPTFPSMELYLKVAELAGVHTSHSKSRIGCPLVLSDEVAASLNAVLATNTPNTRVLIAIATAVRGMTASSSFIVSSSTLFINRFFITIIIN